MEIISMKNISLKSVSMKSVSMAGKTDGTWYEGYPLEVLAKAKKTASAYTIFGNTNSSAKGVGEKIVKNSNGTYSYNGQTLTEQQLCTALGYSSIPSLPFGSTYHIGVVDTVNTPNFSAKKVGCFLSAPLCVGCSVDNKGKYTNRNLWDEEWESGFINQGTLVSNSSRFRSKNYSPINGGATIYVACSENIFSYVQFYDSSMSYLSYARGLNETLSVPVNAKYFKIAVFSPDIDTSSYHNNICINYTDSNNGTYSAYLSGKATMPKLGVQKGDNVITADTEVKPTKIKAKI